MSRTSMAGILTMLILAAVRASAEADDFEKTVRPFIKKHCADCHSNEEQSGGVNFQALPTIEASNRPQRAIWRRTLKNLAQQVMPPEDSEQPSPADRQSIVQFLAKELKRIECSNPAPVSPVTVRRLNKTEYNNTVRDLFGISLRPADEFPEDDVGYGFDNIGDVLSLAPVLMERYMGAAERIAETVIQASDPHASATHRFAPGTKLLTSLDKRGPKSNQPIYLHSLGEAYTTIDCPAKGTYILRSGVHGEQAGDDPVKGAFRINNRFVYNFDVISTEKTGPTVHQHQLVLDEGKYKFSVSFLNDASFPNAPPGQQDRNMFVHWVEIEGPINLAPKPLPASHLKLLPNRPIGKFQRITLERCFDDLVTRAFRRPARAEEVERLIKFVNLAESQGDSPERGVQLALRAILMSPNFLFRLERPDAKSPASSNGSVRLDPYALACRLSYFLWASMPDAELFAHASDGSLHDPAILAAQVQRMLRDPKAASLSEHFASQWLETKRLDSISIDPTTFPAFTPELRRDMKKETELFFAHLIKEDRPISDVLTAEYTFVNQRLAQLYGIAGPKGDSFEKVSLGNTVRGGVLTQASVLTLTSNPTRTSPVKRGKWILEVLLGTPPPPPPPNVPELKEKGELVGTLRQRMEQHRVDPNCASCHKRMDPLGFGMENFDAIGVFRDKDGKNPVDATGLLPTGEKFSGPVELRRVLLGKLDLFRRNMVEKMLTYALGRGVEDSDVCLIDEITDKTLAGGDRFSSLIGAIVSSDAFQTQPTVTAVPTGAKP